MDSGFQGMCFEDPGMLKAGTLTGVAEPTESRVAEHQALIACLSPTSFMNWSRESGRE